MQLAATLFGTRYQFRDIKDLLAKANEEKSGDQLAGVAAESAAERADRRPRTTTDAAVGHTSHRGPPWARIAGTATASTTAAAPYPPAEMAKSSASAVSPNSWNQTAP